MAERSQLVEEAKEQIQEVPEPLYSAEEEHYLKGLRMRMENARNARDEGHEEFDHMPYDTYYELNERLANTTIQPKRNKEDVNYQSGTIRQKVFALLASVVNLNLSGDITAYDKEGLAIQSLGDAMEDIILKTKDLDNDEENKMLRQYELLKHGTVFVEELWDKRKRKTKKLNGKFDGKVKGVSWTERLEEAFARPTRNIIPGINVYLGDITKYDVSDQPYLFTVDVKPYDEAEKIFGEWERWEHVTKKLKKWDESEGAPTLRHDWRLMETKDNFVEIVRYQDKWNNEFAVLLNGVLMTPVGLPLPWGYEDYNMAQQNLEPIHSKFAYGKSLVFRIRNKVSLLDEMMRLGLLKTQKSFMPPYLNVSGRILSNRVLMPGKISHGIPPGTIAPINEKEAEGITQSELAMIEELQESIDSETTSPTFQGQQAEGNPTATEIIELQRQAKILLGLTIFSCSMLEWKLEWKRLDNILANWFKPDETLDKARGELKERFKPVSVEREIEGEGRGQRIVVPSKNIPSPQSIMKAEDALSEQQGTPVRLIFLNPDEIRESKMTWQIVVRPTERKTSETSKLLFRAFAEDAMAFFPDLVNRQHLAEEMANTWEKDPSKVLLSTEEQQLQQQQLAEQEAAASGGGEKVSPRGNLPTAESALGNQIQTQLKQ